MKSCDNGCVEYVELVRRVDELMERQRAHAMLCDEIHEWMTSVRIVMKFIVAVAKVIMFLTALATAIYTGSKHLDKQ